MTVRLLERSLIKRILRIPLADLQYEEILHGLICQASEQLQEVAHREYEKKVYNEIQDGGPFDPYDPDPRFLYLKNTPIDMGDPISIRWSTEDLMLRANALVPGVQFEVNPVNGRVDILDGGRGYGAVLSLPVVFARPAGLQTQYRVTYTGGYPISVKPADTEEDPLDDYGVIQVPDGLKMLLAGKIAANYKEARRLLPFNDEERRSLKPYFNRSYM